MTWQPDEAALLRDAMHRILAVPTSAKGLAPKERAGRLANSITEMQRIARHALHKPPTPTSDTAAFLARMRAAAETGERVTADDVARLRKMADWADAPPAPGWNGTLDRGEAMRAIDAAERRMRDE